MTEWEKAQKGYLYDANYDIGYRKAAGTLEEDTWKDGRNAGDYGTILL